MKAEDLRAGLIRISDELRTGELLPPLSSTAHFGALRAVLAAAPRVAWPRLATAFNEDQIDSKLWLVEHLARASDPSGHRVVIVGAWYGVLALIMEHVMSRPPPEVVCIDIDEAACQIASQLLSILSSRPAVQRADMMELDHAALGAGRATLFINTSCEHLPDFAGWRQRVPSGARLVLQSNNHVGCSEHVNCVPSVDAFARQARLSQTDYQGTLRLKKFQRFMLIGRA